MSIKRTYSILLWVQGMYTLLTALWGLIDIISFMDVSGPKTDIWLVKTVSVLLVPISVFLLLCNFFRMPAIPVIVLGALTATGLASIDFYYTANHTIRWVYAVDGAIETIFLLVWLYILSKYKTLET
jgi:hypothetical protein